VVRVAWPPRRSAAAPTVAGRAGEDARSVWHQAENDLAVGPHPRLPKATTARNSRRRGALTRAARRHKRQSQAPAERLRRHTGRHDRRRNHPRRRGRRTVAERRLARITRADGQGAALVKNSEWALWRVGARIRSIGIDTIKVQPTARHSMGSFMRSGTESGKDGRKTHKTTEMASGASKSAIHRLRWEAACRADLGAFRMC